MLKQGPYFLFEISEVVITRVDCIYIFWSPVIIEPNTGYLKPYIEAKIRPTWPKLASQAQQTKLDSSAVISFVNVFVSSFAAPGRLYFVTVVFCTTNNVTNTDT